MKNIAEFATGALADSAALNGYGDADWETLYEVRETIMPWGPDISHAMAEALWSNPATAKFVEKLNRSEQEQATAIWYEKIASGRPGDGFWAETCLIGLFHAGAGISNRHVVAVASTARQQFLRRALEAFDSEKAIEVYGAFERIFGLSIALMVDSYLEAVMLGMHDIGMNERLIARMRNVAIRQMINEARHALPVIEWSDAISTGIDSIDEQHKVLIALINELQDATAGKGGDAEVQSVLDRLTEYTVEHFGFEEKIFDEFGYPETAEHKEAHVNLVAQLTDIRDKFQSGNAKLGGDLFKFLRSWLNGHIRGTDRRYAQFFKDNNVS